MGNQICVRKLSFLRKRARENGQCYKRNAMLFPDLKAKTDSERREGKGRKNSWNVKNPFFVRRILFCCLDCLERRRKECPKLGSFIASHQEEKMDVQKETMSK